MSPLAGKNLGIIGLGAIGSEVASMAHGSLGMRVSGLQRDGRSLPPLVHPVCLRELFERSDFIVLACPLTPLTRAIVNAETLGLMKPTAFLINVARGAVVDETALVQALQEGRIAGAALDVFIEEPLPSDHPFFSLDTVLLTPHVAGASIESRVRVSILAVAEMERLTSGQPALHPVLAMD